MFGTGGASLWATTAYHLPTEHIYRVHRYDIPFSSIPADPLFPTVTCDFRSLPSYPQPISTIPTGHFFRSCSPQTEPGYLSPRRLASEFPRLRSVSCVLPRTSRVHFPTICIFWFETRAHHLGSPLCIQIPIDTMITVPLEVTFYKLLVCSLIWSFIPHMVRRQNTLDTSTSSPLLTVVRFPYNLFCLFFTPATFSPSGWSGSCFTCQVLSYHLTPRSPVGGGHYRSFYRPLGRCFHPVSHLPPVYKIYSFS